MNINDFRRTNPDGTPVQSMGDVLARYKAGTLDPATKEKLDRMAASTVHILSDYISKFQIDFAGSLAPFIAAQLNFNEALAATTATAAMISAGLAKTREQFASFAISAAKRLAAIHDQMPEALLVLGEYGWFLDLEMPVDGIFEIRDSLRKGEFEEVDEALCDYFESRLDKIEASVLERFPHRAHVIGAVFDAHRRTEYDLSIPILLAQTDGICKELVDKYLFISKDKKPEIAEHIASLPPETFTAVILSPFLQKLPINMSEKERPGDFDGLNRHLVLHGVSVDYGTRVNACKAISLLNYVAHAVKGEEDA